MDFLKNHHRHHSSATSNRSISDTDSQLDEFHSPLRADSPLRSDDFSSSASTAIVAVDKHQTPFRSPLSNSQKSSHTINVSPLAKSQSPAISYNRSVKEDVLTGVNTKVGPRGVDGGIPPGNGAIKKTRPQVTSIVRKSRSEVTIERAALGCRICEVILSLIAFSVMASDKTQGWSGDSFDRYKEYRYLVAVNAIAFTYAAFQAIDLTCHLIYQRHIVSYFLRCHFDFLIDQILAYLLISSSSSAATRIDDWASNWGKDEFTIKASASVVMSFLAFLGFAISCLISGYNLCDQSHI
ncbi:hypothetical protein L2E82_46499 [Cichorium intybus]|uniref:Uncharacterized protein n=1 Tax=Cichorium intybus TaxID=13427 RepID=A0ACB8YTM3_CICIN|nr:hypothetical protein L1887_26205 [Cichorium endivia]KAI3688714.1 hypothetical protein L2E82_46499 [Cichorium intybus]